ncbi:phospholipase D-like domain-containing protein, partial [Spirochaetota bacterium]
QRVFGNRSDRGPFGSLGKKYYVKIGNTSINAYFSPEDNIERIILKRLKKAKSTIHFMSFSFTSNGIGEAMIDRYKKGVKVYGLFERRGTNSKYSQYIKMKIEGLNVRLDRNRHVMHHKVIVIDRQRVITGSYNFSKSANTKNDENILIIDNKTMAEEYLREFYSIF